MAYRNKDSSAPQIKNIETHNFEGESEEDIDRRVGSPETRSFQIRPSELGFGAHVAFEPGIQEEIQSLRQQLEEAALKIGTLESQGGDLKSQLQKKDLEIDQLTFKLTDLTSSKIISAELSTLQSNIAIVEAEKLKESAAKRGI